MKIITEKIIKLKKMIAEERAAGRRYYCPAIKQFTVKLVDSGASVEDIVATTGIGFSTIKKWVAKSSQCKQKVFSKPCVPKTKKSLTLVFPNGMSVSNLSIDELLEISRRAAA